MKWIRAVIGCLVFILLFVVVLFFGWGIRGGYGGFGEEEYQKERSAGGSLGGRESAGTAS